MTKPSMFSNNYEKQMRRRRNIIIISLIVVFGILVLFFFLQKGSLLKNINDSFISIVTKKEDKKVVEPEKNLGTESTQTKPEVIESKVLKKDVIFTNDEKVTLTINDNKIQSLETSKEYYSYDLNPSKTSGVAHNKNNQNTYFFDIQGNMKDITYKQYISSQNTMFDKETVLSNNKNFIWMKTPRFIDDINIAYLSQVPWFEKQQYLWIYNTKNSNYNSYKFIDYNDTFKKGENIEFKNTTENGLEMTVDDRTYYITTSGVKIKK